MAKFNEDLEAKSQVISELKAELDQVNTDMKKKSDEIETLSTSVSDLTSDRDSCKLELETRTADFMEKKDEVLGQIEALTKEKDEKA